MYKTFVEGKILQWREDGGDEFINLNIAIDAYLPEREGKDNTGIFIQVAKQLKAKILILMTLGIQPVPATREKSKARKRSFVTIYAWG